MTAVKVFGEFELKDLVTAGRGQLVSFSFNAV